jgi:glycine dehydrogenase subunit 2
VTEELAAFLPGPRINVAGDGSFTLGKVPGPDDPAIHSYFGNVGVSLRALAYILRIGGDGLTRATECAVLNANYLLARLRGILPVKCADGCMHEFVASGTRWKDEFGVRTLDVAKRMLDYGIHAPTIYFPLIVEEAMMVEPTETESKESLDLFVDIMGAIYREAGEDPALLTGAPHTTPVGRMDEARAAREPDLRWLGPCNC